jgi:hypothetical protein
VNVTATNNGMRRCSGHRAVVRGGLLIGTGHSRGRRKRSPLRVGFLPRVSRAGGVGAAVLFETMPILGWRVHFTPRQLPTPRTPRLTLKGLSEGVIAGWLDAEGIQDGVPFLISPDGHYDIDLNACFLLHRAPENTQAAIAYDLASFLTFLWHHRQPLGKRSWRDATPEDDLVVDNSFRLLDVT